MFIPRPEWQKKAACSGTMGFSADHDFFPERGMSKYISLTAKEYCQKCKVQAECLDYALEHNIKDGIWGGTTVKERRVLIKQRKLPT